MGRLTHGAWLPLGFLMAGCLIVPVPGSLESVDFSKASVPPLESREEGVVVLSTTMSHDEHGMAQCVRKTLHRENPWLRIVPAREFRDALFPWFDLEASSEELRAGLSDPLVRNAIARFNVRYAIFVSEETRRSVGAEKGSVQYVGSGVGWVEKGLTVSADVWDVKRAPNMVSVRAKASGSEGLVGLAVPIGIVWTSDTQGTACRGLGERLGRVLIPPER